MEKLEDMSSSSKNEMPTEILLNESEAWLVRSKETVTQIQRCKQVVRGTLDGRKQCPHGPCVCVCVCVFLCVGVCVCVRNQQTCRLRGSVQLEG
jgi:hypothetical protein